MSAVDRARSILDNSDRWLTSTDPTLRFLRTTLEQDPGKFVELAVSALVDDDVSDEARARLMARILAVAGERA